jgi:predicted DNA-binding protein YlxM (UPF0122 family)
MNQDLIENLRKMFLDGATPSQLMHHIAHQHKDERRLHHIIKDCFTEAFGVPLLRNVVPEEHYCPNRRHAHYNRDITPEIVQRIGDWNSGNLEDTWLESLSVTSLADHTQRLKNAHFEELERVWDKLNDNEKLFIIRKVAMKDHYWDIIKVLAHQTERLQQKIVELEGRLNAR